MEDQIKIMDLNDRATMEDTMVHHRIITIPTVAVEEEEIIIRQVVE